MTIGRVRVVVGAMVVAAADGAPIGASGLLVVITSDREEFVGTAVVGLTRTE